MEWGDDIKVGGLRPQWLLPDDEIWMIWENKPSELRRQYPLARNWDDGDFSSAVSIRLSANHPYYQVARYNAEHSTSFVYWPGGKDAPKDWDENDVIYYGGTVGNIGGVKERWMRGWPGNPTPLALDVIGYTPRQPATPDTETVTLRKMSEAEALDWLHKNTSGEEYPRMLVLRQLGLIRTPTRAETIAAKSGVAVDVVEQVLKEIDGE